MLGLALCPPQKPKSSFPYLPTCHQPEPCCLCLLNTPSDRPLGRVNPYCRLPRRQRPPNWPPSFAWTLKLFHETTGVSQWHPASCIASFPFGKASSGCLMPCTRRRGHSPLEAQLLSSFRNTSPLPPCRHVFPLGAGTRTQQGKSESCLGTLLGWRKLQYVKISSSHRPPILLSTPRQ